MSDFSFNPELHLEREEVAQLASIVNHPGFKVLQKVFRSGVDQFTLAMINTDQVDEKAVLARHNEARTAAKYYTWVIESMNNAVVEYVYSAPSEKPVDSAENLDIDSHEEVEDEEPLF